MEERGLTTHLKLFDLGAQPIAAEANVCAATKCPGLCLKTPQGAVCRCPNRYTLNATGSQCIPIIDFDKPSSDVGVLYNCSSTGFQCLKSKHCVDGKDLCDAFEDCDDGSDESSEPNGPCNPQKCDISLHFVCDNRCYQRSLMCSSIAYCSDLSDQSNCETNSCNSNEFTCVKSGKCIQLSWVNDGSVDCGELAGAKVRKSVNFLLIMSFLLCRSR